MPPGAWKTQTESSQKKKTELNKTVKRGYIQKEQLNMKVESKTFKIVYWRYIRQKRIVIAMLILI